MKWLTILILTGLLCFILYSGNLPFFKLSEQKPSGKILSTQGIVMGRSQNEQSFKNLKANAPLYRSYNVKTGFSSSSLIEFGETFTLTSDSSIELINIGSRYEVHLLSGQIKRTNLTRKTDFYINNNKINIKTITYQPRDTFKNTEQKNEPTLKTNVTSPKKPLSSFHLSLQKTFKLHQRFLEKCFIKHYERTQGVTQNGTLLTEFNVDKKGALNSIKIKKSDYTDEDFHICITEVISRIQMGRQEAEVLKVEFPIQVTLPN